MSEVIENVVAAVEQVVAQESAIPETEQVNDKAQDAPSAQEESAGEEAQEDAKEDAPPVQDENAAKFMQRAAAAFRRGNNALLLSRVECGYWCHEYYSWRLTHGLKDRKASTELLEAALAPYAENTRDVRPADFARYYGIASTLGAVKVSARSKVSGIGDGLTLGKLEALSPLVIRPEGTESYAMWCDPVKTDAISAAQELWKTAQADGKERISLAELTQRVAYLRDPAQGRAVELKQRVEKCKTAQDWDALCEWAKAFGDAMLPNGQSVLAAALEAKAKALAPKEAPAEKAETRATSATATAPAEAQEDEDEEEEEDEDETKGDEKTTSDQRGTVTGNILQPDVPYTAKDAAELCAGVMAQSEAPDDALEALMNAISVNREYSTKTRALAMEMARRMAASEQTKPIAVAKAMMGNDADTNKAVNEAAGVVK